MHYTAFRRNAHFTDRHIPFLAQVDQKWAWLQSAFKANDVSVSVNPEGESARLLVNGGLVILCFSIWHRRNGEHWCLQWQLP